MSNKERLLDEARQYLEHGRKIITINGKKPTLEKWIPLRDLQISIEQVQDWLSSPLAERIALLLDKSLLAFDYDGAGEYVIWDKLVPRCSIELQKAFHQTTLTKTPHGGHILFGIDPSKVKEGVKEIQCWWNGKEHNQVILLSQNKYLVERGTGYQPVRGITSIVQLSMGQVSELISLLKLMKSQTIAIKISVDALLPHYYNTNRDNLTFALSGFLYKGGLEEYLIKDLQEYLMDIAVLDSEEERQERFNVIKNTCAKDRNTAGVSGREKLLEAVNNDENLLIIIQKAFKTLGYFNRGIVSNKNKSVEHPPPAEKGESTKEKEKEEKKTHHYHVQRCTTEDFLAEAVLINGVPLFACCNRNTGELSLEHSISLDKGGERSVVYDPASETSYINKPYSFKSKEEFFKTAELAKLNTLDSLYLSVKRIWQKYIDADDNHISLCSADTIFTYFQDEIGITHYLFFVGDNDSGKSNNLVMFHYLGYRNLMSVGISVANIYQYLGPGEEGIGTLCEDEANGIEENADKMEIAKSGYTKGYPVLRITLSPFGRMQIRYNTFCFKAYSAERAPDGLKAKGFTQRLIKLRCTPGTPQYDILDVTNPAGDEILQKQFDEIHFMHNLLLCYRLIHRFDGFKDIKINLSNREKQLFKPLLRLFQGTNTFDPLCKVLSSFVNERRKIKSDSFHAFLVSTILDMITAAGYDNLEISTSPTVTLQCHAVWDKITTTTHGAAIPSRPLSYDSAEFGVISQKIVTSTLIDIFKAEASHCGAIRTLAFDRDLVKRAATLYSAQKVDISIDKTSGTDGTDGTDRGGVSDDLENGGNEQTTENEKENVKSNEKELVKTEDVLPSADSNKPADIPLGSVPSVPNSKDPTVVKASECLNNHRKAAEARKNKVSEAAAANISGDGVMFGNKRA